MKVLVVDEDLATSRIRPPARNFPGMVHAFMWDSWTGVGPLPKALARRVQRVPCCSLPLNHRELRRLIAKLTVARLLLSCSDRMAMHRRACWTTGLGSSWLQQLEPFWLQPPTNGDNNSTFESLKVVLDKSAEKRMTGTRGWMNGRRNVDGQTGI